MEFLKDSDPPVRRSVLSVPADNRRALEKAPGLDCDAVIYDLEDSVAPGRKAEARDNLADAFVRFPASHQERVIRINGLDSEFSRSDMDLVARLLPDALLLPKVESAAELEKAAECLAGLNPSKPVALWAMIETPKGVLDAGSIAAGGKGLQGKGLQCLVVGLNDLRKATGVLPQKGRAYLVPWLMQIVLAGRAHGVDVIDSVFNDFKDQAGCDADCIQGRAMGFSGKMLVHPAQIELANRHFAPDPQSVEEARTIVAAFNEPGAESLNVVNIDGKMVERLHFEEAKTLLNQVAKIAARKKIS
ncbi:CoA ester lyase [Neorhizobium sp. NCHU2750]|uniref:HpcH/HpaI aldolase/citrate lyase family protein n=1 Tax=Neorhizobium sp. NCHU2750 TaxID=1825976 RepID=UPI000E728875|nr:citrate lyase, beta subunit [Neorhizobium sp. NCHU2750]